MDQLKILEILERNKSKQFVKRLLNADDYPSMQLRDGSISTHEMDWREFGGRFLVYPTIIYKKVADATMMELEQVSSDTFRVVQKQNEDGLKRLEPDAAFSHARETGEFIAFKNMEEASEFLRDCEDFSDRFCKNKTRKEKIYPKRATIWKDMNTGPGTVED